MRTTEVQLRLDAGRIVPGDLLQVFNQPGDRDPLHVHAHKPAERRRRRSKENRQPQQPHGNSVLLWKHVDSLSGTH